MGTDTSGVLGTDARFWDGFLEAVRDQGVKAPYDRWYVIRAEQYLKTHPDTPLSSHRPEEVNAYLTEIGRKGNLKDWQFRQIVDALEALFGAPSRHHRARRIATAGERRPRSSRGRSGTRPSAGTERCPSRRRVSYAFAVFQSVRPARPAPRRRRDGQ
jgi:hypothetical protein